jgi:hypothetical protein
MHYENPQVVALGANVGGHGTSMGMRRQGVMMNVLFSLAETDTGLLDFLQSSADDPSLPQRSALSTAEPFAQVAAEGFWRQATSSLPRPDQAFAVAEAEGEATNWREARLLPNQDSRLLLPNESANVPRLLLFQAVSVADQPQRTALEFVGYDLPFDYNPVQTVSDLRQGRLWSFFQKLRRQTCRIDRHPGGGCISVHCSGTCQQYLISDGPVDRELCTCI